MRKELQEKMAENYRKILNEPITDDKENYSKKDVCQPVSRNTSEAEEICQEYIKQGNELIQNFYKKPLVYKKF